MITDGKIFRNERTRLGITPTQAAKVLGRKDRNSIYVMEKSKHFQDSTKEELKEKMGIDIDLLRKKYVIKEVANIDYKALKKATAGEIETAKHISKVEIKGNATYYNMEAAIGSAYKHQKPVKDFQVHGESMEPNLFDGDTVRCISILPEEIKDNYIHVIIYDDFKKCNVKRIKNRLSSRDEIILRSDNEEYDKPVHVSRSQINEVYMVHSRLSFNMNQKPELDRRVSDLELDIELIKEHLNI